MGQMKTPGVYVVEKSAFPNSVVEVATAVPAFVGYTQKAENKGKPLHMKPFRITSMSEFHNYFGFGPAAKFQLMDKPAADPAKDALKATKDAVFNFNKKAYLLNQVAGEYMLYNSMMLFFQNGGGPCYIVSVGEYADDGKIDAKELQAGIGELIREQEPTMVVIPDAVLLDADNCYSLYGQVMQHCSAKMKNRIAVLDVWGGFEDERDNSCVSKFRDGVKSDRLDFAAAYYPWVNTTIVQDSDLSFDNINFFEAEGSPDSYLVTQLQAELENMIPLASVEKDGAPIEGMEALAAKRAGHAAALEKIATVFIKDSAATYADKVALHKSLMNISDLYPTVIAEMKNKLNLLPPSAAMAGIYTMVDNSRGVWKAPANIGLSSVTTPAVNITSDQQESLNVDINGKSINAIRSFIGEGTLVWGARTLDGNSLDWRYVNVRRTMIMLEESIKLASKAYVFDNNNANTWVSMKSMIRNFLTGIWKRGGLAGASPEDAFSVHVGLGETMTPEDILEGILKITVLVAITRPAEFIEITFQQQMQKS